MTLAEELTAAGHKVIARLGKLDPVERVEVGESLNAAMLEMMGEIADHRRAAVRDLRRTMTQKEVAAELGISPARVQQLEHGVTARQHRDSNKGEALIQKWAGKVRT